MNITSKKAPCRLIRGWSVYWLFCFVCGVPLAKVSAETNFTYPQPSPTFEFPRDHGSHPDFKIEWWYITGHLQANDSEKEYGFQATFFRFANSDNEEGDPHLRPEQIYLAHMALIDIETQTFYHQERINKENWETWAHTERLDIRNGNWTLKGTIPREGYIDLELVGTIRSDVTFSLKLAADKPMTLFGEDGFSQKGEGVKASSYYISFTRLAVEGSLTVGESSEAVIGQAWMDHEISSNQLSSHQVGWDWASLQLDDGRELMSFQLRTAEGQADTFSTLSWVDMEGKTQNYTPDMFKWEVLRYWVSPKTNASYPVEVVIHAPDPQTGTRRTFRLKPVIDQAEITGTVGGIAYWEGAGRVLDESGKEIGKSYLELTGYAEEVTALRAE